MKKTPLTLLLTLVLLLFVLVAPVSADNHLPAGVCPAGFDELHDFMDHSGADHHVGLAIDVNGDGKICVKHLETSGLHVHADNVIQ